MTFARVPRHSIIAGALVPALLTLAVVAGADEKETIRTIQQGLKGGGVVIPEAQERHGLLTLGSGCSASLLRNNWIITAAHCVDDPANPPATGFVTKAEDSLVFTANWGTRQERRSERIITFRPLDIAIVRVSSPFSVNGSTGGFNREIYRREPSVSLPIVAFGRGINEFAEASGLFVTPAKMDGQYRVGHFKISKVDVALYAFPSDEDQSMAGGDSGGPSLTDVDGRLQLVGVHSRCAMDCVPGRMCGDWPTPPPPANYSSWQWVTGTPACQDVPVMAVWDEIDRYIGAFVPPRPAPVVRAETPSRNSCASFVSSKGASISWAWNDGSGQTSIAVFPSDRSRFLERTSWSVRDGGWGDDVKWFAGDFDNDGRTDIGGAWNNGGSNTLTVRRSTGASFVAAHWAVNAGTWSSTAVWLPGHFNRDDLTDVAGVWNDGGQTSIVVFLSDGTKFQRPTQWSVRDGGWSDTVKWFGGDFDGDGLTDIGAAWNNGGTTTLTVRRSTGSGFVAGHWARAAGPWTDAAVFVAGYFDADDRMDVARLWNDGGQTSSAVSLSEGLQFQNPVPWSVRDGGWISGSAVKWTAGDFNGDGRTDIAAAWDDDHLNTLTVRQSTGRAFTPVHWAVKAGGWRDSAAWCAGQFAGATPALSGRSAERPADADALAERGVLVANEDPLARLLRDQQPDGPVRTGFDIGMAAAEGQTAHGPGKQKILDGLSAEEQRGFNTALSFSLERNRNGALASKGAIVAERDSVVADARDLQADPFSILGFDIASGIFGNPALGAQGNTATGPGSLKLRDSLSPAGRRGFDASVALHLSRNYTR